MHTINGKPLGGVLTWTSRGRGGIGGQTVGANGEGQFALLITGTPDEASARARAHIRKIELAGYPITDALFVPNDEDGGYFGNPLFVIDPTE